MFQSLQTFSNNAFVRRQTWQRYLPPSPIVDSRRQPPAVNRRNCSCNCQEIKCDIFSHFRRLNNSKIMFTIIWKCNNALFSKKVSPRGHSPGRSQLVLRGNNYTIRWKISGKCLESHIFFWKFINSSKIIVACMKEEWEAKLLPIHKILSVWEKTPNEQRKTSWQRQKENSSRQKKTFPLFMLIP